MSVTANGMHAAAQSTLLILTLQLVCTGRHVQDACMWPTLAAFAVRAVHTLQVLASHGHLPGNKHKTDRLRSQAKQAFMLPAMDSTYDTLISSVAELLCVLKTTATHQQRVLASGDDWSS